MTEKDGLFFTENARNVNIVVEKILLCTTFVPVSFIVLTCLKLWRVSHPYSVKTIIFSLTCFFISHTLNRYKSAKIIRISMIFGLIASSAFVEILGMNPVVTVSISYGFVPLLACLYYNKRLTQGVTLINYFLMIMSFYFKSFTVGNFYIYSKDLDFSQGKWFLSTTIGFSIEFVFLFIITSALSNKTKNTITSLIDSMEKNDKATELIRKKNAQINLKNTELRQNNKRLEETQKNIIRFIAEVLGSHDLFTGHHAFHTGIFVRIIARNVRKAGFYRDVLTDRYIKTLETAALLHDIGKIHIPEGILNKQGRFTSEEFKLMKSHPEEGKKLLDFLPLIDDGSFNTTAKEMAWCHHEKWNGSGYPRGLAGKEIPLSARIMACADVLDALVSRRLYKDPLSFDEAMRIFKESSGVHFEPCLSDAVINSREELEKIDIELKKREEKEYKKEEEWWANYHRLMGDV
ncbi:MAG: HD domain-containing protein [Treponema sp.]|nr:HD domain-containing protein [Treponema sp.]